MYQSQITTVEVSLALDDLTTKDSRLSRSCGMKPSFADHAGLSCPGAPQGDPGRSPACPLPRPSPPWPHAARRSAPTPHVTTARSSATTTSWPRSASTCPLLLRAAAPRRRRSVEPPPQLPSTPHRLPQPASRHPFPNTRHPRDDLEYLAAWVLHNHMPMYFWISRRYCGPPPFAKT